MRFAAIRKSIGTLPIPNANGSSRLRKGSDPCRGKFDTDRASPQRVLKRADAPTRVRAM